MSRREAPLGGLRVAYSYLVAVMAALLGGGASWGLVAWLYSSRIICANRDGLGCPILSVAGTALAAIVGLAVLGAWWTRLGWLWALWCVAGVVMVVEATGGDPASWWALLGLLVPLVASVVTDPTQRGMSRRRRLLTAGVGALAVAQFVLVVWSATW